MIISLEMDIVWGVELATNRSKKKKGKDIRLLKLQYLNWLQYSKFLMALKLNHLSQKSDYSKYVHKFLYITQFYENHLLDISKLWGS